MELGFCTVAALHLLFFVHLRFVSISVNSCGGCSAAPLLPLRSPVKDFSSVSKDLIHGPAQISVWLAARDYALLLTRYVPNHDFRSTEIRVN